MAYLVVAQDEAKAHLWARGPDGFPSEPKIVSGSNAVIEVARLATRLPFAGIYAGIGD